ncbi:hypothetical protein [Pseudomonas akapageensis]|uniref:hypothetical protein n=1 Tax=Pseudomonas akapageensis TaxID=2609961 RepID=UPI00140B1A2A|nr:hypothetical protein [Pseudomonas akapageensis]
MKLEIARGLFLVAALAVATVAMAAWEEPGPVVLRSAGHCPVPPVAKAQVAVRPDQDLLLFMFGLTQGMRSQH